MMRRSSLLLAGLALAVAAGARAQTPTRIEVTPSVLQLQVGDTVNITAKVFDQNGNEIDSPIRFFSRSRRNLGVSRDGQVVAMRGGDYTIFAVALEF